MTEAAVRTDTKQKILDTAERLFGEHGIQATSLRHIIAEANVNLAAIHYHFQSKEALLEAVVLRRIGAVNRMRLARLDVFEAGGRVPTVEEILDCFLTPVFDAIEGQDGRQFARFIGRVQTESSEMIPKMFAGQFRPLLDRFLAALRRTLPDLSVEDLTWRVFFGVGAMAYTLTQGEKFMPMFTRVSTTGDLREASWRLIQFLAAGFRASQTPRALP